MLSRQAGKLAKKDLLSISPNLGAFASLRRRSGHALRETQFFLIFSLSQNFKYLWLDLGLAHSTDLFLTLSLQRTEG